jgi:hypothetical protein
MEDAPDLYCREYQENPAPTLAGLRAEDPVHRSQHGYWFVTRYRDVILDEWAVTKPSSFRGNARPNSSTADD